MQCTVRFATQHNAGVIDRRIFGGFLEHMGRAVYEGVFDPGNPLSDQRGFRKDVLEALRPLGMPVIRYPGGNFVSNYDWQAGIGPAKNRPVRPDFAWRSFETNQFGTDEFMAWCKEARTEPMMAVNLGTGNPAEAGNLLEYCNFPGGTSWADRRKQNGHAEPYGVKLWCLGNEMDGPWQAGHVPADVYAQRANAASKLMKGLDSTIQTVVAGSSGIFMGTDMRWDREVLEYCWDTVDFISAHRYSNNDRNDTAWFLAEGVEIDRVLEDYAGVLSYVRAVKKSSKKVHVCFDEWNVWYKDRQGDGNWKGAPHLLEEVYNLEDAIVCAQYMSSFIRRADLVKIGCIAQIVNVIAPILTRPDGILLQSIYHPFLMYSRHAKGKSLTPTVASPTYRAGERGEVAALDAAASFDEETETAAIFLINRDATKELTVEVAIADRSISRVRAAEAMGGGDVKAANTWEHPNAVKPFAGKASVEEGGKLRVAIPAPGLCVVKVKLAGV